MPGGTRTRRVLLLALPLAAHAALLAGAADDEAPLAAAMPRVLVGSAIAVGIAWLASGIDNGRGGRWGVVVGLAMAMCATGSVAFALSLGLAMLQSGGAFAVFIIGFFGMMLGTVTLIVIHVIETCLEVGWRTAAVAVAAHAVALTALIMSHDRAAAFVVAVASLAGGALALLVDGALGRRAKRKNRP